MFSPLGRCRSVSCICFLSDQSLNPNLSTSTDPSPSCIPPLPCLIHIPTSTLCPNADPSLHLLLCSENPCPTPSCSPTPSQPSRLGSPPGRGQTDQNQSQVDQLSPTATWWNVFGKPCLSCPGFSRWMLMSLTQRLLVKWHYLSPQQPLALSWGKISWHVHWLSLHSRNTL